MLRYLFSFLKGREVVLDRNVPSTYLFFLGIGKLFSLIRGLIYTKRIMFVGRGTVIYALSCALFSRGSEIGNYCSIDCLGSEGLSLGKGSKIGDFSVVKVSGTLSSIGIGISIGDNVSIGEFAHIGGAGGLSIGNDTISGAYLSIHPENHVFDDSEIPIRLQGVVRSGVVIGNNCWLGAKVTFLDGSGVGDRCVVAAGAVVTKLFPSGVLIAGCPAKVIRKI